MTSKNFSRWSFIFWVVYFQGK